jgi:hypothetical protein
METKMTEILVRGRVRGQAADTAKLHVGSRGFGIFAALLRAVYEARRRQAERDIRRHQYLLDRYAPAPLREQFVDPSSGHWMVSDLMRQPR